MDITRWSTLKSDYTLCSRRWRSSIQSAKTRLGTDCGSDHENLIAKFRLKLKKTGKTTRPFWCDLSQIPFGYTVEVTNRFKGLDLTECLKNYGWRFITLPGGSDQNHLQKTRKKKCKKAKWLFEEALQISEKKRRERQRRKGKIYLFECRVSKNSKER